MSGMPAQHNAHASHRSNPSGYKPIRFCTKYFTMCTQSILKENSKKRSASYKVLLFALTIPNDGGVRAMLSCVCVVSVTMACFHLHSRHWFIYEHISDDCYAYFVRCFSGIRAMPVIFIGAAIVVVLSEQFNVMLALWPFLLHPIGQKDTFFFEIFHLFIHFGNNFPPRIVFSFLCWFESAGYCHCYSSERVSAMPKCLWFSIRCAATVDFVLAQPNHQFGYHTHLSHSLKFPVNILQPILDFDQHSDW